VLLISDGGNCQLKAVSTGNTTYGVADCGVINCDNMSGGLRFAHNDSVGMVYDTSNNLRVNGASTGQIGVACTNNSLNSLFVTHNGAGAGVVNINTSSASFAGNVVEVNSNTTQSSGYSLAKLWSGNYADVEFNLRGDGTGLCDGSWTGGGADYAEYFEWADGNIANEDRRGFSVSLVGNKIKKAQAGDTIIGVISGNPSVVGDAAWNKWSEKYLRDDFGTYLKEDYEVWSWDESVVVPAQEAVIDGDGNVVQEARPERIDIVQHSYAFDAVPGGVAAPDSKTVVVQQRRVLNPAYNPDQEYVSREERPEWDAVGLVGKLRVRKGQPVASTWIKMRDISASVEEWLVK
jgi:hypothetical protein